MQSGAIYLPLTPKLLLTPGELHSLLEADTIMINVKTGFAKSRVRKKWPNMATLYHSNASRIMLCPEGAFGIALSHSAAQWFRRIVNYFRERAGSDTYRSTTKYVLDRRTGKEKFDGWLLRVARSETRSNRFAYCWPAAAALGLGKGKCIRKWICLRNNGMLITWRKRDNESVSFDSKPLHLRS